MPRCLSSSQHALSPSKRSRKREHSDFLSLFLSCIQSTTDDIIIIAYRHHFKTYSFTLSRERNTSPSYCQIWLVIQDETYEIKERKWLESSTEVCYLGQWFLSFFLVFYYRSKRVSPWQGAYNGLFFSLLIQVLKHIEKKRYHLDWNSTRC